MLHHRAISLAADGQIESRKEKEKDNVRPRGETDTVCCGETDKTDIYGVGIIAQA